MLIGHRGLVTHVEITRDGRTVYSASADGTLRRWDVATGAGTVIIDGAIPIRGFGLARDGRLAVQAGDMAYLVNARGTVTRLGKGGSWCIAYAEFDAVTDRLVIHRCDNTLAIIDERSEDNGRARASRGSSQSNDKTAADPELFKVTELPTGGYPAGRIATSPDGREIAAAISDRTIRLWDAVSGRVIDTLRGHSDMVLDVAFSPDGSKLASASYDRTIAVWGLATGRHRVLRGHTASVTQIAWRGLGQLVTGSTDGTVRLWDVPSLELPSASEIAARLNAATTAQIELDRPASSRLTHGT